MTLEERAKQIFGPYHLTEAVRQRYERDWVRSVQTLGDKWLFAKYAGKLTDKQKDQRCADGTYKL